MKHSTRLAALMAATAIFAFLPGAQVCGQSPRHGGGGGHHSSVSGGSHSSGHSSTYSHGSSSGSHSRSGGSVSSGSSSHRSSGSVASGSHNKPQHSGGSVSSSQHRPSGGSVSGGRSHSRPSGGSSGSYSRSDRPSGHVGADRPANRPSDVRDHASRVPETRSGDHRPDVRPNGGDRRPEVNHGARRPGGYNDGVYRSKPASPSAVQRHRPAPGSRPYADGTYGRSHGAPAPSRVHPHPGARHPGARPAPREVHGTPYHFSRHGHHHYGHYLPAPPPRYVVRHYWGRDYYYYNDIWYTYHHGRYWICRPPWGYVFSPLADAVYTACTFAYYFDRIHYYDTINENASTIVAQNETIAANNAVIASQNETIARNAALAQASGDLAKSLGLVQSYASADTEYFYNDGVFYVKSADGQYTVIVPPAGALVESLPEDFETIELGGENYYKVDDTIYRTVVVDGKAMFEVLGQLVK